MKKFYIYRLVNENNEVLDEKVIDDCGDNLCIGGEDSTGKYHQYDSYEAWHARNHFEELNVGLRVVSTEATIDTSIFDFK